MAPRVERPPFSAHQSAVLALGGLRSVGGLSAPEVSRAVGIDRANAYKLLKRLTELGQLEPVPGEEPARWRRPGTKSLE